MYSSLKGMETKYENGESVETGPLIKILKADMPLSIQVHPDDKMAQEVERQKNGKSESWMILEAEKNATMIVGLKNYNKEYIKEAIENKTFIENLKVIKSKKGQFINVPAGMVHGVGAGNLVFEIQQPSDTTYRYYDYDRLENGKERELHIEKSLLAQKDLSYELTPIRKTPLTYKTEAATQIFMKEPTKLKEKSIIIDLSEFQAYVAEENEKIKFNNYVIIPF